VDYSKLKTLGKSVSKFVVGMEGNISEKKDNSFYIKSSGSYLNNLDDSDFVCYDFFGNQLNNFEKKGSLEIEFHKYLLGFDFVNFVCHTHPTNTLKILCTNYANEFSERRLFPDQVVFNGKKSCLIPYKKPGKELFDSLKNKLNEFIKQENFFPKLILLQNHGIISCGRTIEECIIVSEICEKSAEIFLESITLKNVNYLTDNEINDILNDENEKYRKSLI
jgi:L-fuculose-phosphate aldolase